MPTTGLRTAILSGTESCYNGLRADAVQGIPLRRSNEDHEARRADCGVHAARVPVRGLKRLKFLPKEFVATVSYLIMLFGGN